MNNFKKVAIDGPAAAGKSTIAKLVARQLGFVYVDTGAMYRALAFKVLEFGVDLQDATAVHDVLMEIEITLLPCGVVLVDGQDVTEAIRGVAVSGIVSQVATYGAVRDELKRRQVMYAESSNVIMDGRDIGTNVMPDADFKFFMVADARVRAHRRYRENLSRGIESDLDVLLGEIEARDEADYSREHSPLLQATDAILIDTGDMSIDEVVNKIVGFIDGSE